MISKEYVFDFVLGVRDVESHFRSSNGLKKSKYFTNIPTSLQMLCLVSNAIFGYSLLRKRLILCLAWKSYTLDSEDFLIERISAYVLASEAFLRLGNSGAAAHRRSAALSIVGHMDHYDTTTAKKLVNPSRLFEMLKLRHPDPSLVQKMDIQDACLQVRGSWKKVAWPKSGRLRVGSRLGFSSFTWKGGVNLRASHQHT